MSLFNRRHHGGEFHTVRAEMLCAFGAALAFLLLLPGAASAAADGTGYDGVTGGQGQDGGDGGLFDDCGNGGQGRGAMADAVAQWWLQQGGDIADLNVQGHGPDRSVTGARCQSLSGSELKQCHQQDRRSVLRVTIPSAQ